MMMLSELPEDLLEEVLCRVPAAYFKPYTCRRWNRLFNNERFRRKQFDKPMKQSLILMLKEFGFYSMRINLHRVPPVELIGELSLIHPRSSLGPIQIRQVSHCDGLLLCVTNNGLVVWNPCTGQTLIINVHEYYDASIYALGSYQDKNSKDNISYKILSQHMSYGHKQKFKIYEINSISWRVLNVTIDFSISEDLNRGVSLKGKTYLMARDEKRKPLLVSFDYTTERFERLCLPHQLYPSSHQDHVCLSVVREEKLSVLLQRAGTLKTEIWVTNKIGDESSKVVSWRMVFTVYLRPEFVTWYDINFWIDEEKKVVIFCDNLLHNGKYKKIHIVGEDNKVRTENLEVRSSTFPVLLNYVPSLAQIF